MKEVIFLSDEKNILSWGENESNSFIVGGNVFVPDRIRQYSRICSLFPNVSSPIGVLDLCCGEGLLSFEIAKKSLHYELFCYDNSSLMLESAKKHLGQLPNKSNFKHFDLLNFEESEYPTNLGAVVSSLAIHHMEDSRKKDLFKFIYSLLPSSGLFVMVDVILPMCKEATIVAAEDWDIAAYKQSVDFTGSLDAYKTFKEEKWNIYHYIDDKEYMAYDKPSTVYEQLKWLDEAGFSKVDVLWMYAGHIILYGIK